MLLGCSLFVATDYASPLYTSVDAHGAGASTVPCNSLAVVNLRPCLVKKSQDFFQSQLKSPQSLPAWFQGLNMDQRLLNDMLKDHVTPSNELIEIRCDVGQGNCWKSPKNTLPQGLISLVPNAHFQSLKVPHVWFRWD